MDTFINIFEFSDYRVFLNSWLKVAKNNKAMNLSRLAEVAQVHPTFLSHILSGNKHLSFEQAAFISQKIGLTHLEQDYFYTIIHIDRAGTDLLRLYWTEKKAEILKEKNKLSKRFNKHKNLSQEQKAEFYSNWLYSAMWLSTAIHNKQTLIQVAERFRISPTKAEKLMQFLTEVGLCYEKNGYFLMGETHVHVDNDSPFVLKHHTNWRIKALQDMSTRSERDLFFTGPMSISKKDFDQIRESITKLIKDIVEKAKKSSSEELVCLNIDFFENK